MDLATYRAAHGLTQSVIASLLVEAGHVTANQSLISQWERGELPMSAEWCVRLEQVTHGGCTRLANRPDLFGVVVGARRRAKSGEVKGKKVRRNAG